jgi:hypothetical protein
MTADRPVMIDFGPPQILLLSTQNHLNPGGTGVLTYRVSEPVPSQGYISIRRSSEPIRFPCPDSPVLSAMCPCRWTPEANRCIFG